MYGIYLTNKSEHIANFINVQLTHHIPTKNQKPMRIRTGYECVIPNKTSSTYVGKAKQDGKITNIDPKLKLVTITYKDGTIDVFEFGDIKGEASGMGVNHAIAVIPDLKIGSLVKANDIITYHEDFFQFDPITRQVAWCHGIPATVAIMGKDVTLEDSNLISTELAEKLRFDSIYTRTITVSVDMIVDSYADVGSKVSFNDPLIRMKYEDMLDIVGDVDELFDDLKQIEYRSKHNGEVVGIHVYHSAEVLNASLTQFIQKVTAKSKRKANVTKGTRKEEKYSTVTLVPAGTRIQGVQISDTDVLIIFSIKSNIACGIGDKIIFDNSLKSVVGRVEEKPITTEEGKVVDAVFGANSIQNRIITSPLIYGIADRILEQAEQDIIKMYFEK